MKKFLMALMALMLLVTADVYAQRGHRAPVRRHGRAAEGIGVDFGYVHSWYRTTDWASDELTSSTGLDGFFVGLNKDFVLVPYALFLQTGLDYTYLNDAKEESFASLRIIGDRTEHYARIPVRLKYLIPVTDRIKVGLDAGPSFSCALSSKLKYRTRLGEGSTGSYVYNYHKGNAKVESMPAEVQSWIASQQPDSRYRRIDVQLGVAAGAEFFDILEAKVGFDFGLVNRLKGEIADDFKTRRGQFYLAVGLRF